jgi:hypothetical protein
LIAKLEKLFLDVYMYFDSNVAILQKGEEQAPAILFVVPQLLTNHYKFNPGVGHQPEGQKFIAC